MPLGSKRPNAGRKVGFKFQTTLQKIHARELVRQKITENLNTLIDAQIDNAQGIRHLMMRDPKTGKFERITGDAKQIDKALKSKNAFWIYTKDPNVQAFTDLMNRCIDRPSEHVEIAGAGSITIRWQTDDEGKESGEVLELSEDERIRHARRVNGHVDNGESS
jgi:hypothetical protein